MIKKMATAQSPASSATSPHKVVVIGGGFAGVEFTKRLARRHDVEITLLDQRNHHIFQPLLYQVATSILPPSMVAWPIRQLLRACPRVRTVLAEVVGVDGSAKTVVAKGGAVYPYDTLVIATGAKHAYFGHDSWETVAPGLKTLGDATSIRRRILLAFERAEAQNDPAEALALLTFVVVGAGPTGVELAGTIADLAHISLPAEYRHIDTAAARVLLLEAGPRILPSFNGALAAYAQRALQDIGVEVRTATAVTQCSDSEVWTTTERISTRTIIWAAGVQASNAALWLNAERDQAGRVVVTESLTVQRQEHVFVVGDTASIVWKGNEIPPRIVPGLAPAAKQQGAYVAKVVQHRLEGLKPPAPFAYVHQGSLATIGRNRAIIDLGPLSLTGSLAWWIWGVAHIYFLITPRSRFAVIWSWLWAYLQHQPAAQLISETEPASPRSIARE